VCPTLPPSSFFLSCSCHHRPLHSFPTRRSSDLVSPLAPTVFKASFRRITSSYAKPSSMRIATFLVLAVSTLLISMLRAGDAFTRSEEHTSELQSRENLVCRLLLEKKKKDTT